ncbi:Smr/MutS family protein [Sinorhizobium sp. BG8]|uniref:Smr/MutS family protein n=1 Tax=Sinorhizobium sp. BG8 TaxID=2613773 RepID=UPI00193E6918|nr:Smr/MutS family protein [Sinorhizobium sp. BG8]QRM53645.1 Smr/MutS family protein [Sinorhizobium sp. BG8]
MARDRKPISNADRILWGKVARSTRPLPGRMEDLLDLETVLLSESEALPRARVNDEPPVETPGGIQVTAPSAGEAKRHHPLERPVKRKIAKGKLPLDARIDLHGMIQSEAHGFLLDFLLRAHQRGLRHVLVITGKGTSIGSDGALKRAVPLWFSLPEFRPLISSFETAARTHGGEGALYVRLSRMAGGGRP